MHTGGYIPNFIPSENTKIIISRKDMNQSENINELATALAKCQGEMEPAIKDSINPHFKNKFATLYSIWEACRKPLSKNGLSVVQTMDFINDKLCLTTKLLHSSGQWIGSVTPVIYAKNDAQGIGSALSYFKRYSLSALLGICTADEDDDGNAAMPSEKHEKPRKEPPKVEGQPLTSEQRKELHELADLCDPDYMAKVYTYLESMGIRGFDGLKSDKFDRVIKGMKTNAESTQKAKG